MARPLLRYFCFVLLISLVAFFVVMSLLLSKYETVGFPVEVDFRHMMIPSEGRAELVVRDAKNGTSKVYMVLTKDESMVNSSNIIDSSSNMNSTNPTELIGSCNFDVSCLEGDSHHYKMVVGILSAKRTPPTVVEMVQELVRPINGTRDYKLLIWRSESTSNDVRTAKELSDLGTSVVVNTHPYPELDKKNLKITFKDSVSRVIWRTSHVLDYSNLLELAFRYDSEFVMILEDDLKPAKFALDKSYQFAKKYFSSNTTYFRWGLLTMFSVVRRPEAIFQSSGYFCFCGACALIIRKELIPDFIKFLRKDPYAAPVDMMLWTFLTKRKLYTYERTPNLFQHIGLSSTYTAKDQSERRTERMKSISFDYNEDNRTDIPGYDSKGGYVGCFKDNPEHRDFIGMFSLPSYGEKEEKSSPELCEDFCNGYYYFALQNGDECYCGNRFGKYGPAPEEDCHQKCKTDTTKSCGGTLRNSVYRTSPSFYSYVGCFLRSQGSDPIALSPENAFPGECKALCKDQSFIGIYESNHCVCLSSLSGLRKKAISLCSRPCSGNPNHRCGGKSANYMSVYKLAGIAATT